MFKRQVVPEFLNVPWRGRDVLVLVLVWFGLQGLLGVALVMVARSVPSVAEFLRAMDRGEIGPSFAFNLAGVLLGLGIVALCLRRYHVGWGALGWRRVSVWRTIQYLFGIMLVFVVLANGALLLVQWLVPSFDPNQAQTNDFTSAIGTHTNLALVALVLLPPIFEETIFRGFIFPALSKRRGVVFGAIGSSAIFGIAHGQPNLFVYTFILGLLLCFMYVRMRSIVPGIVLHMLNNFLAFVAISGK